MSLEDNPLKSFPGTFLAELLAAMFECVYVAEHVHKHVL